MNITKNIRTKLAASLTLALPLLACSSYRASATTYYWDGNDTTSGFGTAGGTWADPTTGTLTSGWSTDSTGVAAVDGNSVSTTTSDSLNFGSTAGLAGGTITVSGTVNSGNMTFANANTSGSITLSGGTINFADSVTISVGAAGGVIDSLITGASTSLTRANMNGTLRLTNPNNSYTGQTVVVGTVEATSLANGGLNSSIGASSSAVANIVLGAGNRPGTLKYIGGPDVSTDRLFTIGSAGTYAVSLDSSGTGTLNFTNTGTLGQGTANQARTLTLSGSNTGLNTLNPLIGDNGTGAISVTKSGTGTWELANNDNSYTGPTTVSGGTLVITSIANYGTNSAIGKGTNGTAITIASGNTSGTLIYTGGAQETDRMIQINTSANAASGATTILNNGTGTLTFTSATFNPTYANGNNLTRTLVLGGTNDGVILGTIQDSSATVKNSVTKTNAGTWTLSGANTYSGATTVSAGTLLVNGDSSAVTNRVTVKTNATLGGNGTIGGSVTVNDGGNLSPGTSVGTLSIGGNLDVSALAAGTTGKLRYELGPISASDSVAVAGTLTIGSGVLGISDFVLTNIGGLQAGTYTLITSGGISGSLDPNDQTNTLGAFTAVLQTNGNNLELVVTASVTLTPPVLGSYGPRSGSSFPLTFSGPSGQTYQVLSSTNVALPLTNWNVLTNGTFGTDPVNYTDTGATNARQFYRIQSP